MPAWPLVGREEELTFVLDALRGDRCRGVVIAGAIGVGKTRLAREVVAALGDDAAVEWVAATNASASIPFGSLAHLVDDGEVGSPEDRLRLVRVITSTLVARAAGRRLVLGIDDAQWLDVGAAAVVHHLVATGTVTVLVTVRTSEAVPEPVVALWKDGWAERLELQPLSARDLHDLVRSVVARPVDRGSLDRLWSLTGGNALFVHELLRGALESEAYTVDDGVWRWSGDVASTRLPEILASRFARVSARAREVLTALAVGEPLPADVLVGLFGADAVVEVERLGLAGPDEASEGQVRLHHPLYAEALRSQTGVFERRQLLGRLADAVEGTVDASPSQRLRLAVWRLDSGAPVSPDTLTEAAKIANGLYDHDLAARLGRQAVAEGAGFEAALVLGDALNRVGRSDEGLAVLEPLLDQAATDEQLVELAVALYFGRTSAFGFRAEFADEMLTLERRITDPRMLAFLRAQRASLLCSAGRLEEGVALAERTVSEHSDPVTALRAVSPLVSAWLCAGRPDAACAMTERMLGPAVSLREQVPQAPGWVMSLHLPALVIAGRLDDADAATTAIEAMLNAAGGGTDEGRGFIAMTRGMSSLLRGSVETARDQLRESVALIRPVARWRLPFALVQLVEASALAGDAETATAASAEADELVAHHAVFEGVARRARGWAALARGEHSAGLELFHEAAVWSAANGQRQAELLSLHDTVRLGETGAVARLQAVAESCEGRWAPCYAAHGAALASGDGAALESAASAFEEVGARLLAAEASAQASGRFSDAGFRARAERSAARAWSLWSTCEEARSPVIEELRRPLPLTRREREVALLAAQGLSSPAIAERLFVSTRTVEGHLQNAYTKLGVNDRKALAALLTPTG